MTVLIVGAGAAGLTAAFTLLKANITDFTILEANDRLGGRLMKNDSFASFPIDLGGEWIHVDPIVLNMITQDDTTLASIATIPHIPEEYLMYEGPTEGWTTDLMDMATPENLTDTLFVNYTWFDFFNDKIALPQVRDKIIFDCPVTTIQYDSASDNQTTPSYMEGTVVATCANGDIYKGSHILVTASVGVLQSGLITFVPELPQDYKEALESIPMLLGIKMFFKFDEAFYPDVFESDVYPNLFGWDETFGEKKVDGEHVMGVLIHAPDEEDAALNNTVLLAYALEILDEMFDGNATKYLLDSVVQNWAQEPYALGSYSHFNDTDWAHEHFKYPVNATRTTGAPVLFFAGEAFPADFAAEGNGYAHGAALSGQETAKWMMEVLLEDDGADEDWEDDSVGDDEEEDGDSSTTAITKPGGLDPSVSKNGNSVNTETSTVEDFNLPVSAAVKYYAPISAVAYSMLVLFLCWSSGVSFFIIP